MKTFYVLASQAKLKIRDWGEKRPVVGGRVRMIETFINHQQWLMKVFLGILSLAFGSVFCQTLQDVTKHPSLEVVRQDIVIVFIIIKESSLLVSGLGKNVNFLIFPATDAMRGLNYWIIQVTLTILKDHPM